MQAFVSRTPQRSTLPTTPQAQAASPVRAGHARGRRNVRLFGFSEAYEPQEAVGPGRQEVSCPRSRCRLATDPKSVRLKGWVLSHCITSPL